MVFIVLFMGCLLFVLAWLIKRDPGLLNGEKARANIGQIIWATNVTGAIILVGGGLLLALNQLILLILFPISMYFVWCGFCLYKSSASKLVPFVSISFIVFVAGLGFLFLYSCRDPEISYIGNKIIINGIYSTTYDRQHIKSVSLQSSLPTINSRSNGFALGEVRKGWFNTAEGQRVRLYLQSRRGPCIRISGVGGEECFINFGDSVKTLSTFDFLMKKVH